MTEFKVHLLTKTVLQPEAFKHLSVNGLAWLNAHRCYSEKASIVDNPPSYLPKSEAEAGEKLLGQILKPGHFGVLEGFYMGFEVCNFPHDVMVQHRTHRLAEYNVQSQRYSGQRVLELVNWYKQNLSSREKAYLARHYISSSPKTDEFLVLLESIFYTRPCGVYPNSGSKPFTVTKEQRIESLLFDFATALTYYKEVNDWGYAPEVARQRLAQSIRQGYTFSCSFRSLLHLLDLRSPKNAQWEIRKLAEAVFQLLQVESPEITTWYSKYRLGKQNLSP